MLWHLQLVYPDLGQYQKAIEYHTKALEIAKEIKDIDWESKSYTNLGNSYESLGQYEKAIEYHTKALEIAKEIKDID